MRSRGEDDAEGGAAWVVLRHSAAEGLGTLGLVLRDLGIHYRTINPAKGEQMPKDLRGTGGLIILGGEDSICTNPKPYLLDECALVETAITEGTPVLGICLGAQIVAHVLGGRVFPGDGREVGWGPVALTEDAQDDPLFLDLGDSVDVFHLHGDTFELPPDAHQLARTDHYEQQAFEWGSMVYGLQFHLEFTPEMFERIVSDPAARKVITDAGHDPDGILADAPGHFDRLAESGRQIFERYFEHCGI